MARIRISGTGAACLTALDGALGKRTPPHGLRFSQFVSELTDGGWDIGGSGHILSYGMSSRKINGGNAASLQVAPFFDLHPEGEAALRRTEICGTLVGELWGQVKPNMRVVEKPVGFRAAINSTMRN